MGASKKLLLQYITAILLIALLTWHLVIRVPALRGVSTFAQTLANEKIYSEVTTYGALVLLFGYVVLLHAFNGLRNMVLEWTGGKYNAIITIIIIILFIVFAGLATYTVVGITPPPTG